MILIDAVFINNGGGKVLLDYLITELEKTNLTVLYLLDYRVDVGSYKIKNNNKIATCTGIYDRHVFYQKHKDDFTSILCFGNVPPTYKTKGDVNTYFHNPMYLEIPSDFSLLQKLFYKIKRIVIKQTITNTSRFIVQSRYIKDCLLQKFHMPEHKVIILPFYPPFPQVDPVERVKNSYIYVSNGTSNKNYPNLINSFCKFQTLHKKALLTVTVDKKYSKICSLIEQKQKEGYPINNIGFISRDQLKKYYLQSEYLIFPSFTESFGLGIVEGIENGCKVIGSDLPYLYEVCKPSLTFNPYEESSIFDALCHSYLNVLNDSESLVKNNIDELVYLIKYGIKR
jgi:glycosyltransferase involved in cell wall biosynthesis